MTIFEKPLRPTPVLETRRLILRPLCPEDAPAIQRRFPQWEVVRYLNPRIPWPYPDDGAARFIAVCLEEMARREKDHWSIRLKDGPDELIGSINLWRDDGKSRDMRGFWLDPEFQGRRLMTEAAGRMTDYAFHDLDWPRLWGEQRRAQPGLRPRQGKAGCPAGRPGPLPLHGGEGLRMVWLNERGAWLTRNRIVT